MHWLIESWRTHLPVVIADAALAIIAVLCGAIVGAERERREKPAGLRTLILVCLGAALFTMASFVFNTATGDSGRVAAQIVTGIGFLGAGAILHGRGTISGMTTAATIWVMAAIGMIAGAGYVAGALGASVLVRLLLGAIRQYEIHLIGGMRAMGVELDFEPNAGLSRVKIERVLADYQVTPTTSDWEGLENNLARLRLQLRLPRRHLAELLAELVEIPAVKAVRQGDIGQSRSPVGPEK